MNLSRLFSPCLFAHVEGVKDFQRNAAGVITKPRKLVMRCLRCQADLGAVLPGQRFTARREPRPKQGRSAEVLRPAKFGR